MSNGFSAPYWGGWQQILDTRPEMTRWEHQNRGSDQNKTTNNKKTGQSTLTMKNNGTAAIQPRKQLQNTTRWEQKYDKNWHNPGDS